MLRSSGPSPVECVDACQILLDHVRDDVAPLDISLLEVGDGQLLQREGRR